MLGPWQARDRSSEEVIKPLMKICCHRFHFSRFHRLRPQVPVTILRLQNSCSSVDVSLVQAHQSNGRVAVALDVNF